MYKTNIVFIVSFILLGLSLLFFYNWYFDDEENRIFQSKSERIRSKAPLLISLFDNIDNDPHNKFISSEQCLLCHEMGMEIDREDLKIRVKAPQMNYKCKIAKGINNCQSCHKNDG